MTLYDQTKMTEPYTVQLLSKEILPVKIGIRGGNPMVCLNPHKNKQLKTCSMV